jgi:glycerol uptake facilitator-like aquaporin
MLLYAINLQKNEIFGEFGIAFMLFACLLIGGPITGAHYNPAVTVGVYICNKHWKEDFGMFCVMIGGQVTGGIVGVMLAWVSLYNNQGNSMVIVSGGGVPTDEIVMLLPD